MSDFRIWRGSAFRRAAAPLIFLAALLVFAAAARGQLSEPPPFSALGRGGAAGQGEDGQGGAMAAAADKAPPRLKLLSLRVAEAKPPSASEQNGRFALIAVFNEKPDISMLALDEPPRLVLSLPAAQFVFSAAEAQSGGRITRLRRSADGAGHSRLILTMRAPFRPAGLHFEPLNPGNPGAPWQLTALFDTVSAEEFRQYLQLSRAGGGFAAPAAAVKAAAAEPGLGAPRLFRVMIDPGHGDFDSGAVGVGGVREKQVTLAFAKTLCRILREQPGIMPFLTRSGDAFLRLGARVDKARAARADLFISIHADYIAAPNLHGATVYTLSDKASDDLAKLLAEHENKSDLLDGLPPGEPPAVTNILLDMTRRETRVFSEDFARILVRSMQSGGIDLNNNPHRSARFQVLRAADIPSVLVELGYLSNAADEKRLANPAQQEKMARIIAGGIAAYAQSHAKSETP